MFLHLINLDPKFPPLIRKLFEEAMPGEHVYVLLGDRRKIPEVWEGFHVVETPEALAQLLQGLSTLDGVILNGVLGAAYPYLSLFSDDVSLIWVIWGVELYEHLSIGDMLLHGPLTRGYFKRTLLERVKAVVRPHYWKLQGRVHHVDEVLSRISHVVTQLPAEFQLVKNRTSISVSCRHIQAPVILLEDLVDPKDGCENQAGQSIQVGNSAHPSNNHLEAFEILQGFDLTNRKVSVPLSYGDPRYRDFILARGREMLGDAFQPITNFLSLEDYLFLMKPCSLVIMNHYRQQALGNVIAALWRGARVYLGPSATYTTYHEWGLSVFALDDSFCLPVISLAERWENLSRNREILQERLGSEVVLPGLTESLTSMKEREG